ncbi:MAG: hypothetical protein E6Q66_03040 [Pedobacter sp.]|nr:MAG: hypothetical protein E6Q66_03040 [Pedobacter sp.]
MEQGWVKIYTSSDFFKSEMVRQVLAEYQIVAVIINKKNPYQIGDVEIYIHQDDFQEALEIIVKNDL